MDSLGSEQTDGIGINDFFCWNHKGPWCSGKVMITSEEQQNWLIESTGWSGIQSKNRRGNVAKAPISRSALGLHNSVIKS